jgi:hypothetical protein
MSLRQLARIALHLLLAVALAAPAFATFATINRTMGDARTSAFDTAIRDRDTAAAAMPCHSQETPAVAPGQAGQAEDHRTDPFSDHATDHATDHPGDHPRDHGCADGLCSGHVCDMSACLATACLPRSIALSAITPVGTVFAALHSPPAVSFVDIFLRPPIDLRLAY